MDNYIKIVDENGNNCMVEVIDIFGVSEYPDKEYILYTRGKDVNNENIEAFVSILKKDNEEFSLLNIEDDEEWKVVSNAINEMGDENE